VTESKPLPTYEALKAILKVVYAPQKAFKEISENPKYIGPILIMILFIIANIGFAYAFMVKTSIEQTLPTAKQLDEWTENSTSWTNINGLSPQENYNDCINGTYYGNRSIEFSAVDSAVLSMQLNNLSEPVNCSSPDGYRELYLRIKWTSPENKSENATIYLYSVNPSDYFYYNLTKEFLNSTLNVWNNLTIPLDTENWSRIGDMADWGNINSLKLVFLWPENSNITVLVDGLFFGGIFKSPVENTANYMINFSIVSFMQFFIRWVFIGGLIYVMNRAFRAKIVWRPLVILVGFALITMLIQVLINTAAFSVSPKIYYPFELIGGVKGEGEIAYNRLLQDTQLVSIVMRLSEIMVYVWTIALCAIAIRLLTESSWSKSLLIATVAYFATLLAESFIIGY